MNQVAEQLVRLTPGQHPRFGGTGGSPASDAGDVAADGNLVYPADGSSSVNGTHYTPDVP